MAKIEHIERPDINDVHNYGTYSFTAATDIQQRLIADFYDEFYVSSFFSSAVQPLSKSDVAYYFLIPVALHNLFVYEKVVKSSSSRRVVISSFELNDTIRYCMKHSLNLRAFESYIDAYGISNDMLVDENYNDASLEAQTEQHHSLVNKFFNKFKDEAKSKYKLTLVIGNFKTDVMSKTAYGVYTISIASGVQPVAWQDNNKFLFMPVKQVSGKPAARKPIEMTEDEFQRLFDKYSSFEKFNDAFYIPKQDLIERFIKRIIRI